MADTTVDAVAPVASAVAMRLRAGAHAVIASDKALVVVTDAEYVSLLPFRSL
jgi:hypothetical protein